MSWRPAGEQFRRGGAGRREAAARRSSGRVWRQRRQPSEGPGGGPGRQREAEAGARERRRRWRREGAGWRGGREAEDGRRDGSGQRGSRPGPVRAGGYEDEPAAGPRIASRPPPPHGSPSSRLRTTHTGGESGRTGRGLRRAPTSFLGARPEAGPGLPAGSSWNARPSGGACSGCRPGTPRGSAGSRAVFRGLDRSDPAAPAGSRCVACACAFLRAAQRRGFEGGSRCLGEIGVGVEALLCCSLLRGAG